MVGETCGPGARPRHARELRASDRQVDHPLPRAPPYARTQQGDDRLTTELRSSPRAPARRPINRCLGILQGILQRAVEWRRISGNPVAGFSGTSYRNAAIDARSPEIVESIRDAMSLQDSDSCRCSPTKASDQEKPLRSSGGTSSRTEERRGGAFSSGRRSRITRSRSPSRSATGHPNCSGRSQTTFFNCTTGRAGRSWTRSSSRTRSMDTYADRTGADGRGYQR